MFDHRGDIVPGEGNSDGIYLHDTRFLSQLELRLNGAPLLLLSSNVQEDNAVLTVDLANPELISRNGVAFRAELIHVNRLKYIWQNACYERLLVHNFDTRAHDVRLGIRFAADFADLFEVRGQKRARRGQVSIERRSGSSVVLRYLGLDEVERFTSIEFEPAPTRLDAATALHEFSLGPGEGMRSVLRIACRDSGDQKIGVSRQFYSSLRTARRALRSSSGRAASVEGVLAVWRGVPVPEGRPHLPAGDRSRAPAHGSLVGDQCRGELEGGPADAGPRQRRDDAGVGPSADRGRADRLRRAGRGHGRPVCSGERALHAARAG